MTALDRRIARLLAFVALACCAPVVLWHVSGPIADAMAWLDEPTPSADAVIAGLVILALCVLCLMARRGNMTQRVSDEDLARWAMDSESVECPMWEDRLVLDLRDARAEVARLREASAEALKVLMLSDPNGDRLRAFGVGVDGDLAVLDLCKRHGYGAVMDSAARQWRFLSDGGAHTTGACVATVQKAVALLRAAIGEE